MFTRYVYTLCVHIIFSFFPPCCVHIITRPSIADDVALLVNIVTVFFIFQSHLLQRPGLCSFGTEAQL